MTDDARDAPSGDDFRPEDFLPPEAGGPTVSPDFVARTFAKVRADQARIRDEAARVDEIRFPRELLDAYTIPPVGPGFVDAALARVREDAGAAALDDDALHALLANYAPPSVSGDFVERTLDALRLAPRPEAGRLRALPEAPSSAPRRATAWRFAAAAAAVIAIGLAIANRGSDSKTPEDPFATVPVVASSQEFTPAALGTALSRWKDEADGGVRFEPIDGLLFLASAGEGRAE